MAQRKDVPEENRPGHRPARQQDKPAGPPPVAGTTRGAPRVFRFATDLKLLPLELGFGVVPQRSSVRVGDGDLSIRYGLWHLQTPLDNIEGAEVTGPYSLLKVGGPARISLSDHGVTFATTNSRGVCISFKEPVAAALPFGLFPHPSATVTVEEPDELAKLIGRVAAPA